MGDIIASVNKATELGADIINMSIGFPNYDDKLHAAIKNAASKGIIIVCSAGNDGKLNDTDYPAAYPEVISVGSHDITYRKAKHTDYGEKVQVYSAGSSVISTDSKDGYITMDGTSMAAPTFGAMIACLKKYFIDNKISFTLDNILNHLTCQRQKF
jgi:subtilisin family serine protease